MHGTSRGKVSQRVTLSAACASEPLTASRLSVHVRKAISGKFPDPFINPPGGRTFINSRGLLTGGPGYFVCKISNANLNCEFKLRIQNTKLSC